MLDVRDDPDQQHGRGGGAHVQPELQPDAGLKPGVYTIDFGTPCICNLHA